MNITLPSNVHERGHPHNVFAIVVALACCVLMTYLTVVYHWWKSSKRRRGVDWKKPGISHILVPPG
jgi:hypothetical protein